MNATLPRPPTNRFNMMQDPGVPQRPVNTPSIRAQSSSVFDLNHIGQRNSAGYPNAFPQDLPFVKLFLSLKICLLEIRINFQNQQNTHTSCLNCSQQQLNWNQAVPNSGWDPTHIRHLNGSNMSLNIPPSGYYPQRDMPPPGWQGWAPQMYPYPVGMFPIMNQGNTKGQKMDEKSVSKLQFLF